ncbi:hypothetical protein [Amycolatopsis sp. NPDC049868]|uniref:hypothetical protein n=1 Tax=Amycolatopsis sp. NPDC049868 TaxID=3363934 RepID=UPI00378FF568
MNITEFADRYVGYDGAAEGVGPATREFAQAFGVEPERAELMLAARLWVRADSTPFDRGVSQRITRRRYRSGLRDQLMQAGASRRLFGEVKTFVVPHAGGGRFDLVVLDPGLHPAAEPILVPIDMSAQVDSGRRDWLYEFDIVSYLAHNLGRGFSSFAFGQVQSAIIEVGTRRRYSALVVPSPGFVPMTAQACLAIRAIEEERAVGTVGVAAVTDVGEAVLTTAWHAVHGRDDLYVSGHRTSVVGSSEVLDCALLAHPYQVHLDVPADDVLEVPPRVQVPATFDGARSGPTRTMVRGFDMRLMSHIQSTALCVLTDADTAGGDSGAALYDSDGKLIGFCSERTEIGAPFECTSWIWASQVLRMMRLSPQNG